LHDGCDIISKSRITTEVVSGPDPAHALVSHLEGEPEMAGPRFSDSLEC